MEEDEAVAWIKWALVILFISMCFGVVGLLARDAEAATLKVFACGTNLGSGPITNYLAVSLWQNTSTFPGSIITGFSSFPEGAYEVKAGTASGVTAYLDTKCTGFSNGFEGEPPLGTMKTVQMAGCSGTITDGEDKTCYVHALRTSPATTSALPVAPEQEIPETGGAQAPVVQPTQPLVVIPIYVQQPTQALDPEGVVEQPTPVTTASSTPTVVATSSGKLTEGQKAALVYLLRAFGVDEATIHIVEEQL